MHKFEAGKTYAKRLITDADQTVELTVERRTAKTIVTSKGERLRIKVINGCEKVWPWGSYSMAPIVGADMQVQA